MCGGGGWPRASKAPMAWGSRTGAVGRALLYTLGRALFHTPLPLLLTGLHTQGGLFRKRGLTWGDWLWKTPQSLPTASFALE